MGDFYVALPSNTNLSEFPNNQPNNFKVRLAEPLRLRGGGWSVRLSSVPLPDEKINLFSLGYHRNPIYFKFRKVGGAHAKVKEEFKFEPKEVLMKMDCHTYLSTLPKTARNSLALGTGTNTGRLFTDTQTLRQRLNFNSWNFIRNSSCRFEEVLQDHSTIVDGVEFMRFLINQTIQAPLKRLSIVNILLDFEDQPTLAEYEWVEHVGHDELRLKKEAVWNQSRSGLCAVGYQYQTGCSHGLVYRRGQLDGHPTGKQFDCWGYPRYYCEWTQEVEWSSLVPTV